MRAIDVPCRVRGGGRFLDQPEVRAVIKDLQRAPVQTMAHVVADLRETIDATPDDANAPAVQERKGHLEGQLRLPDSRRTEDHRDLLQDGCTLAGGLGDAFHSTCVVLRC